MPGAANATSGRYGGYSRDRGASWTNSTIPGHDGEHPYAHALVVVPRGPRAGRVISIGTWGLAASDDGGATYAAIQPWWGIYRFGSTGALAVLAGAAPGGGDRLVASFYDNSDPEVGSFVYVSDDGGDTWRRTFLLTGDPNSAASVAVDLGVGQALIVMNGGHVWRTADAGETWSRIGVVPGAIMDTEASDPRGRVQWAKLGPDGRLYVGGGSLGRNIELGHGWMLRSSVPLAVAGEASPEAPGGVSLSVHPNPSSGAVVLSVSASTAERVRVEVIDATGRVVHEAVEVWATPSGAELRLPSERWAVGVYVARASVGRHTGHVSVRFTVVR